MLDRDAWAVGVDSQLTLSILILEEIECEAAQEAIARFDVPERAAAGVKGKVKRTEQAAPFVRHAVQSSVRNSAIGSSWSSGLLGMLRSGMPRGSVSATCSRA